MKKLTSKQKRANTYIERVKWASKLIGDFEAPIIGVEVGLWKADFAKKMLDANPNLIWYGIDQYAPYGHQRRKQPAWDEIYQRVCTKMEPYQARFTLIRKPSYSAWQFLPDNVSFIFIDGNHDYDFVLQELYLYEKKLRPGGIMSGHDYCTPADGVRRAVNKYIKHFGRELNITIAFDRNGVYWWQI